MGIDIGIDMGIDLQYQLGSILSLVDTPAVVVNNLKCSANNVPHGRTNFCYECSVRRLDSIENDVDY